MIYSFIQYKQERARYYRLKLLCGYSRKAKPGQCMGSPGEHDDTTHVAMPYDFIGEATRRYSRGPG